MIFPTCCWQNVASEDLFWQLECPLCTAILNFLSLLHWRLDSPFTCRSTLSACEERSCENLRENSNVKATAKPLAIRSRGGCRALTPCSPSSERFIWQTSCLRLWCNMCLFHLFVGDRSQNHKFSNPDKTKVHFPLACISLVCSSLLQA